MSNSSNKMSVFQLTILTAVNMMGSGIIMLPSKLAQVGALSIVSWLVTAVGSMCLAYVFAKCGMYAKKGGGMGGYAEYSFGKAGNFMANYTYGVSLIFANTAIAISAVGYALGFLNKSLDPIMTCAATIFTLWLATVLNFGGAKYTGRVSSITVWGVIIPCIGLALIGWFWFSPSLYIANWNVHDMSFGSAAINAITMTLWAFLGMESVWGVIIPCIGLALIGWFWFSPSLYIANWNVHDMSFGSAAINAITMTLWAFLGMESACANADAVDNPETNVPKAVLGGTLIAAACYIVSTNIIFGIIPSEDLVSSSAPFGLVFAHMFGPTVGRIIMGLMLLSCFGSLLGWQFTIANVFKAGSDVGYFPAFMKKITSTETPLIGMVTITVIQSLFSLMTISPTLNDQFETLVNLAVITNIIPYLLCMAAIVVIMKAVNHLGSELKTTKFIAFVASIYSLYACYASGFEAMTYGAIVTFFGWTLYGLVSDKFDLDKAEADNKAIEEAAAEAAKQ